MRSLLIVLLVAVSILSPGQFVYQEEGYNPIHTSAWYLQFAPDARSVGAGESGVASSPDLFSMFWNPAKFAFIEDRIGIAVSFSDYLWMNMMWKFNDKMDMSTGFNTFHASMKIKKRSALAFSFTYFDALNEITFTDEFGQELGTYKPYDLNLDVAYSLRLTSNFSAAVATRYIYSNLGMFQFNNGTEVKPAQSMAFDLAVYYQKPLELGSKEGEIRWGIDLSNIGMKMSYVEDVGDEEFLPANLRLGAGFTYKFDNRNSLSVQFDANKLQVPTTPYYLRDSLGHPVYDKNNNPVIEKGMDPDVSVVKGMVQSWYDAPGGFEEEIHEWAVAGGFEYRYKTFFSARSGIFYEHKIKGNRRYYTAGAGFKAGIFGMDLGLKFPIDRALKDDYISIFYLRTSIAIGIPKK